MDVGGGGGGRGLNHSLFLGYFLATDVEREEENVLERERERELRHGDNEAGSLLCCCCCL